MYLKHIFNDTNILTHTVKTTGNTPVAVYRTVYENFKLSGYIIEVRQMLCKEAKVKKLLLIHSLKIYELLSIADARVTKKENCCFA